MSIERHKLHELRHELSRRDLLRLAGVGLSGLGLAAIVGCGSDDGNAGPASTPGIVIDPPPETTTIRLPKSIFNPHAAPLYLAEQFLPAEGFTNVQYIDLPSDVDGAGQVAAGEIDIGLPFASSVMAAADARDQVVILAGVHNSSFVLFGNYRVQSLRDLKGKRILIPKRDPTDSAYAFMATLLAYVGIDPEHEVQLAELKAGSFLEQAFAYDAWLLTRPYSTGLQKANVAGSSHVVLDAAVDPPWSHYFGGMATGNRGFVDQHPAATKRALRAILKGADLCAREPERAARDLVDGGRTPWTYDRALDVITGVSYAAWREFNPEDTVRFYALRLREAGLVKSTPDELIARATDWRYLNEIKRELGV